MRTPIYEGDPHPLYIFNKAACESTPSYIFEWISAEGLFATTSTTVPLAHDCHMARLLADALLSLATVWHTNGVHSLPLFEFTTGFKGSNYGVLPLLIIGSLVRAQQAEPNLEKAFKIFS